MKWNGALPHGPFTEAYNILPLPLTQSEEHIEKEVWNTVRNFCNADVAASANQIKNKKQHIRILLWNRFNPFGVITFTFACGAMFLPQHSVTLEFLPQRHVATVFYCIHFDLSTSQKGQSLLLPLTSMAATLCGCKCLLWDLARFESLTHVIEEVVHAGLHQHPSHCHCPPLTAMADITVSPPQERKICIAFMSEYEINNKIIQSSSSEYSLLIGYVDFHYDAQL